MEGACGVRLKADDDVSEIFKNGRASISLGYIGIHETVNALFGNQHVYDSEALREKAVAIVARLREATDSWKEETGYGFSLYSTPSENLCDRFCRLDTAEFGVVPGVTDKGYYTNSFHLDVEKKVNPYDKIDFEAPYHRWLTAASFATANTRTSSTTCGRSRTCGITATSTCRITAPTRRSMNAMSAATPVSSNAPARVLTCRNAAITTPRACRLPVAYVATSAARTLGRSTPASRKKLSVALSTWVTDRSVNDFRFSL
ncbi:Anaerobic ribonucleoside-triphosphate reductase [Cedecea neteri]|uniref:Anaerobic ribonucleoside-triphosphate reductase n=1 Tax=Cedecea neteri TaxID=158822 RepID=A0A2X2T2B5_9ENTR|nr:Anaerobic ribonucleoside-triphosphate reductase [Cedecea neteri]